MRKQVSKWTSMTAAAVLATSIFTPLIPTAKAETTGPIKLRIMETTDLHASIMPYDYYKDADTNEFGFAKTATLIRQARSEVKNSLLFDNGDLIQGNPLADYIAKVDKLDDGQVHPVYKALNLLGYDAATLGNHEFNYGLDYLNEAMDDAKFPYVNANIFVDDKDTNDANDKNQYTPYIIIDKVVEDASGVKSTIKVGVIGLVTPQIMQWDKGNLEGKVKTKDIVATAEKFIPEMKAKGADLVIALAHTGFDASAEAYKDAENAVLPLSKVAGLDAILFGHKHVIFPGSDASFKNVAGVDATNGTINGVASVEAGYWGNSLGVVDLTLEKKDGKWTVTEKKAAARPIYDKTNKKSLAEPAADVVAAVAEEHKATLAYVRGKIGTTTAPMYSYFARVQDDPTIQIVTASQKWYVEKYVAEKLPQYKGVKVLSAGAPFKAGRQGPSDYTNVVKGDLSIKSANDLYLYPNTLKAVELTGAQVKEWLEMSAAQFNQINPESKEAQSLINAGFEPFNFDVIDGVYYDVDVTQPSKYKPDGTLVNPSAERIKNFRFADGTPVNLSEKFLVVTNNYRASGGGNFPGLVGGKAKVVVDSADENRQILMDYIQAGGDVNPSADRNWRIAPINETVVVTFKSSLDAKTYLSANPNITLVSEVSDEKGTWGQYALDTFVAAPIVSGEVKDTDNKVRGTVTEAGSTVVVKVGSRVIGSGVAMANGEFLVTILKQKAGTVLTVAAVKNGVESVGVMTTIADTTPPARAKVKAVQAGDTVITGTAEAGTVVQLYKKGGIQVVGQAVVGANGKFTVKIQKQKAGHKFELVVLDISGNTSAPVAVEILKKK